PADHRSADRRRQDHCHLRHTESGEAAAPELHQSLIGNLNGELPSAYERRGEACFQRLYCSRAYFPSPTASRRLRGARKVTWMTPGARPISIAPLIVARLRTSGTLMPSSLAARCKPLSIAAFILAAVP